MPITRSAIKKLRQDKKREKINKIAARSVKEIIKTYKKKPSLNLIPKVYKMLDFSVKKGILHRNKAARLKSRLSKILIKKQKTVNTTTANKKIKKVTKKKKPALK